MKGNLSVCVCDGVPKTDIACAVFVQDGLLTITPGQTM